MPLLISWKITSKRMRLYLCASNRMPTLITLLFYFLIAMTMVLSAQSLFVSPGTQVVPMMPKPRLVEATVPL
jgi:hypothetical protein